MDEELTERQKAIVELLWKSMKKVPKWECKQNGFEYPRVYTSYGTKTKIGLARSIESIFTQMPDK